MNKQRPTRPFGLGDLMVIIASTAVIFAGGRWIYSQFMTHLGPFVSMSSGPSRQMFAMMFAAFVAASLTPAQLVLRLRRPRPRLRVIGRHPGSAASVAALFVMAVQAARVGSEFLKPITHGSSQTTIRMDVLGPFDFTLVAQSNVAIAYHGAPFLVALIQPCGFAVAGAWLTLAMTGRWRPEPSWIDRLGRVLGFVWLALTAAATASL